MILELDVGNSRIKWRVLLDDGQAGPVSHAADNAELEYQLASRKKKYRACRVCMVRSAQARADQIRTLLARHVDGVIVFAQSSPELAGVQNAYPDPRQLGIDRWLALVAAYNLVLGSCIVIDAGTAVTADFVSHDGHHLGGMIAPGYRLLEGFLVHSTGLRSERDTIVSGPQNNTADCLLAGMNCMMQGFVRQVCDEGVRLLGGEPDILLTGGDAPMAAAALSLPHKIVDDLVFKGLALACPLP